MTPDHAALPGTAETGMLGICHLKRYWARQLATLNRQYPADQFADEWPLDHFLLSSLGIGIEQTLRYLYREKPDFEAFEKWICHVNNGSPDPVKVQAFNAAVHNNKDTVQTSLTDTVLTHEELEQWERDGYVIVRNAIPAADCRNTIQLIEEFLQVDRTAPSTWYREHDKRSGIMVEFYQHPQLEKNRQATRIRIAFEQLWKQKGLLAETGKTGFAPPHRGKILPVTRLHWDVSLHLPIPFGTQGMLYLTDTTAQGGALKLVPGFHRQLTGWLQSLPTDTDPRTEDLEQFGTIAVAAAAGDLVIWHHALPHAAGINRAAVPRFVQYINYTPPLVPIRKEWK